MPWVTHGVSLWADMNAGSRGRSVLCAAERWQNVAVSASRAVDAQAEAGDGVTVAHWLGLFTVRRARDCCQHQEGLLDGAFARDVWKGAGLPGRLVKSSTMVDVAALADVATLERLRSSWQAATATRRIGASSSSAFATALRSLFKHCRGTTLSRARMNACLQAEALLDQDVADLKGETNAARASAQAELRADPNHVPIDWEADVKIALSGLHTLPKGNQLHVRMFVDHCARRPESGETAAAERNAVNRPAETDLACLCSRAHCDAHVKGIVQKGTQASVHIIEPDGTMTMDLHRKNSHEGVGRHVAVVPKALAQDIVNLRLDGEVKNADGVLLAMFPGGEVQASSTPAIFPKTIGKDTGGRWLNAAFGHRKGQRTTATALRHACLTHRCEHLDQNTDAGRAEVERQGKSFRRGTSQKLITIVNFTPLAATFHMPSFFSLPNLGLLPPKRLSVWTGQLPALESLARGTWACRVARSRLAPGRIVPRKTDTCPCPCLCAAGWPSPTAIQRTQSTQFTTTPTGSCASHTSPHTTSRTRSSSTNSPRCTTSSATACLPVHRACWSFQDASMEVQRLLQLPWPATAPAPSSIHCDTFVCATRRLQGRPIQCRASPPSRGPRPPHGRRHQCSHRRRIPPVPPARRVRGGHPD